MTLTAFCALVFGGAAASCVLVTPLVRRLALEWKIQDEPDGHRKLHERPIPLMGGFAVYLAVFGTLTALCVAREPNWAGALAHIQHWWPLLAAATIICSLGILDDVVDLRATTKLLGQFAAASVLYAGGIQIQRIELFGTTWDLGLAAFPFTLFWLLGAMNAINLLDGMDGLASGIGAIMSGCVAVVALSSGSVHAALVAAALSGALVGFLFYNFPPASIFLGDCGSMLIGLVLGAIAIESSLKAPATVAFVLPVAVLTIPILDSTLAIVRRWYMGLPFHAADRGHIHHRLLAAGLGRIQTLACLCGLTLLAAGGVLLTLYFRNDLVAVLVSSSIVVGLIVSRVFGHQEFSLLRDHVRTTTASVADGISSRAAVLIRTRSKLAECSAFDDAWAVLNRAAADLKIDLLEMVTLPERTVADGSRWCLTLSLDRHRSVRMRVGKHPGESTRAMLRRMGLMSAAIEEFRRHLARQRWTEPAVVLSYASAVPQPAHLREAS
jgi:UDP-GlcNAc:undecaprenyl-phosphate GlcNAc-1-phosphate transferase